jgi:aspartate aminotransferase-like enzyme
MWARPKDYFGRSQTPWTPPLSVVFALDYALEGLEREGLENIDARHQRIADLTRRGVKDLGLELLADERFASNTVTAVKVPESVEVKALRNLVEDEYDMVLAGGQGVLQGKIFRIGHLGAVDEADIRSCLDILAKALPRVGYAIPAAR